MEIDSAINHISMLSTGKSLPPAKTDVASPGRCVSLEEQPEAAAAGASMEDRFASIFLECGEISAAQDERLRRSRFINDHAHGSLSSSSSSEGEHNDETSVLSAASTEDPYAHHADIPYAAAAAAASIGLFPVEERAGEKAPIPSNADQPSKSPVEADRYGNLGCPDSGNTETRVSGKRMRGARISSASSSPPSPPAERNRVSGLGEGGEPPEPDQEGDLRPGRNPLTGSSTKAQLCEFFDKYRYQSHQPESLKDAAGSSNAALNFVMGQRMLPASITNRPTENRNVNADHDGREGGRSLKDPCLMTDDTVDGGYPRNVFEALEMLLPEEEPSRRFENVDILEIARMKGLDVRLTPRWWRPGGYDAEMPNSERNIIK